MMYKLINTAPLSSYVRPPFLLSLCGRIKRPWVFLFLSRGESLGVSQEKENNTPMTGILLKERKKENPWRSLEDPMSMI